jgi:hypothetical protein
VLDADSPGPGRFFRFGLCRESGIFGLPFGAQSFGGDGIKIEAKGEINHAIEIAKASNASGKSFLINAIIGKTDFRKGSISV